MAQSKLDIIFEKCYHFLKSYHKTSKAMGSMSIRRIPDKAFDALKRRAARNGRSAEAEVRAMIEEAALSDAAGGFGTRLQRCFEPVQGTELSVERDKTPAEPIAFE